MQSSQRLQLLISEAGGGGEGDVRAALETLPTVAQPQLPGSSACNGPAYILFAEQFFLPNYFFVTFRV